MALGAALLAFAVPGCVASTSPPGPVQISAIGRIVHGADPIGLVATLPPDTWAPDASLRLDAAIPVPWAIDAAPLDPTFNPYVFRLNAGMLCAAAEAQPEWAPTIALIVDGLLDRMLERSVVVDGARFVEYRYPYEYEGLRLDPPWYSAFGNAEAVLGAVAIARCWPSPRVDAVIDELVAAFERTEADGGPWFRRDLADGVWFEEIAVSGTPVMVLNGHLEAVLALSYARDRDPGDARLRSMIEAGLRGALAHLPQFRRRGEVLCYDLSPPCHPDYGPVRTIDQLEALARIAPDSQLAGWSDVLSMDLAAATTATTATTAAAG